VGSMARRRCGGGGLRREAEGIGVGGAVEKSTARLAAWLASLPWQVRREGGHMDTPRRRLPFAEGLAAAAGGR